MSRLEILKSYNGEVHFRGISFRSATDIDRQLEDCQARMDDISSKLKQLAIATPNTITPSDYTPMEYINEKVDDLMMDYFDVTQTWNLLNFARGIINDYAVKDNISMDDAFNKCWVDTFSDLRK